MAVGDVRQGFVTVSQVSLAPNNIMDIRPTGAQASEEWVIHNIYYSAGVVEFYKTDGTNFIKFDSDSSLGAKLGTIFHVTNSQWIQIKNLSGSQTVVAYDGIQSK